MENGLYKYPNKNDSTADIHVMCLETFHCVSEVDLTQPLKARDYKDPLIVLRVTDE